MKYIITHTTPTEKAKGILAFLHEANLSYSLAATINEVIYIAEVLRPQLVSH